MEQFTHDICVIGGGGRVGLPLAIAFARAGLSVAIHDISATRVAEINAGRLPFIEEGAGPALAAVIGKKLSAFTQAEVIATARHLVVVIGTPVDEHLNPAFNVFNTFLAGIKPHLRPGQLLILRSTVYPGTTDKVRDWLLRECDGVELAFCPERIAEGKAMEELSSLPQIVSGFTPTAVAAARALFAHLTQDLVELAPLEAELAKLFTNSWRYIQFAVANQFYMIADSYGLDFYRIHEAMTHNYPRARHLPRAGFAAGPCLFKDTMQIAAFNNNNFALGHSAMLVNEGLPNYIVKRLKEQHNLRIMTIGLLGMAFKTGSDDPRESLSYKLKKILEFEAQEVLAGDEYINDPSFTPMADIVKRSDLIIIGAPHDAYRSLVTSKPVVDIWNLLGRGGRIT